VYRKKALSYIDFLFSSNDIIIFIGKTVCSEVDAVDRKGILCFTDDSVNYLSVALGIAMTTNKRVLVVCEDYTILRYFSSILQIASSGCTNLFFIVLVTGEYTYSGGQPTIFGRLRSPKGMLFNSGMLTHDYNSYFKNKTTVKNLRNILDRTMGPVIGLLNIDDKKIVGSNTIDNNMIEFIRFVRDVSVGTSAFRSQSVFVLELKKDV